MAGNKHNFPAIIFLLTTLITPKLTAQVLNPPQLRNAIVGDPVHQVAWTDEALEKIKAIGFNEVQINIAWGYRPFDEALNLNDVVTVPGDTESPKTAERRAELKRRVKLAQKHG